MKKILICFMAFLLINLPLKAENKRSLILVIDNSDTAISYNWIRTKIIFFARKIWKQKSNNLKSIVIIPLGNQNPPKKTFHNESKLKKEIKKILTFDNKTTYLFQACNKALNIADGNDIVIVISDFMADHERSKSCSNFSREDYKDLLNTFDLISLIMKKNIRFFPVFLDCGKSKKNFTMSFDDLEKELKNNIIDPSENGNNCGYNYGLSYQVAKFMANKSNTHLGVTRTLSVNQASHVESILFDILSEAKMETGLSQIDNEISVCIEPKLDIPMPFYYRIKDYLGISGQRIESRYINYCRKKIKYFLMSDKMKSGNYNIVIQRDPDGSIHTQIIVNSIRKYPIIADDHDGRMMEYKNFLNNNLIVDFINKDNKCVEIPISIELVYKENPDKNRYKKASDYKVIVDVFKAEKVKRTFISSETTDEDGRTDVYCYQNTEHFMIKLKNDIPGGDLEKAEYEIEIKGDEAKVFWSEYEQKGNYQIDLPTNQLNILLPDNDIIDIAPYDYQISKKGGESRSNPYYKGTTSDKKISQYLPVGEYYIEIIPTKKYNKQIYLPCIIEKLSIKEQLQKQTVISITIEDKLSGIPYTIIPDKFYSLHENIDFRNDPLKYINMNGHMAYEIWGQHFKYMNDISLDSSLGGGGAILLQWKRSCYPFHVLSWILINSIKTNDTQKIKNAFNCLKIYHKLGYMHPTTGIIKKQDKEDNPQFERDVIDLACSIWNCLFAIKLSSDIQKSKYELRNICSSLQIKENNLTIVSGGLKAFYRKKSTFNWRIDRELKQNYKDIFSILDNYGAF